MLLTGADCFILALERHQQNGNTCHYVLELDGFLSLEKLRHSASQSTLIAQLAKMVVHRNFVFTTPYWKSEKNVSLLIEEYSTDEILPQKTITRKFNFQQAPLFTLCVLQRKNGKSALVLSWNHLLMDGYGAVLFLKSLAGVNQENIFLTDNSSQKRQSLLAAKKAKNFIDRTSKAPLSGIHFGTPLEFAHPENHFISFSTEETKQVEEQAINNGAKFGVSAYCLAVCAAAVSKLLSQKNIPLHHYWVPIPQNKRKKGATGPLLGNYLSFLFYRIDAKIASIQNTTISNQEQMLQQVKEHNADNYHALQQYLKKIPSSVYYNLIKGPQGNSLSSFLFTMAEEHSQDLNNIFGLPVTQAWSLPPNLYPPGLTFAFMRFNGCLQLMICSYEEVLNQEDSAMMEKFIRQTLLSGKIEHHAD